MVMRRIEVDDEVYALLLEHAQPFVDRENDVLRRLLGLDGDTRTGPSVTSANRQRIGDLMPLIDVNLLAEGDELVHIQPRRGLEHRATVTADGYLELADGRVFGKPSPALKACVGHDINGWDQWTHTRSGRRLKELREELRRK